MSNKKSGFRNSGKGTVPVDTIVKVVLRLLLAFVLMGGLIGMSMYLIHRDIGNKTDVEERYDSGVSNNIKGKDVADDIDSGLYIANIKCNYFVPGEEIIVSVNNGETWTKYNHYEHDKELDIKIKSGQTIIIGYKKDLPDAQVRIMVEHLSGNKNEVVINTIGNEYVYNTIEKIDNV